MILLGAIMVMEIMFMGDSVISRVYYVRDFGHKLFSVGPFWDSDLEVGHSERVFEMAGFAFLTFNGWPQSNVRDSYPHRSNGTEFVNMKNQVYVAKYYARCWHKFIKVCSENVLTPKWRLIERRNHTLVKQHSTMMIFSKAPMFLWAEAVATACYTQNRSLIHTRHNKTPYELVHDKKPDLTFF
ncbi:integrase, catalytic region, zinc finger, CCHC-type containing protein [Tanacetum coccineum]